MKLPPRCYNVALALQRQYYVVALSLTKTLLLRCYDVARTKHCLIYDVIIHTFYFCFYISLALLWHHTLLWRCYDNCKIVMLWRHDVNIRLMWRFVWRCHKVYLSLLWRCQEVHVILQWLLYEVRITFPLRWHY